MNVTINHLPKKWEKGCIDSFYNWITLRVQNIHPISDLEFDNIIDKI